MNKAIAYILKEQLSGLPVIEKKAGLVQVAEYEDTLYDETGASTTYVKRIPVSQDVTFYARTVPSDLVPDGSKSGILYFEDGGTQTVNIRGKFIRYRSRLRLVVWLNAERLIADQWTVTPQLTTAILSQLRALNATNVDRFLNLRVNVEGMPKQDKAIFAPYTYDLHNTGYIMPPYEFFAIDLNVEYSMNTACLDPFSTKDAPVC
jgi:hypothetical protein